MVKQDKMKKKQRMHYYGVLATYNPYDDTWYAFHNDDLSKYLTERDSIDLGKGKDALSAMNDYLSKKITSAFS
jgi:hypothetical protein